MNSKCGLSEVMPIWSNPGYIAGSRLWDNVCEIINQANPSECQLWIDMSCGTRPYEALLPADSYIGVDVPGTGRPLEMKTPIYSLMAGCYRFPTRHWMGFFQHRYWNMYRTQMVICKKSIG